MSSAGAAASKASGGLSALGHLPGPVQAQLSALREALVQRLGEDLLGLLVFGSAVRGGYRAGESDVDVLVVVRHSSPDKILPAAAALRLARDSARIEAVILKHDEISNAADVFPLFYDDIRRCHVRIHGEDPFAGLVIEDQHKRLRIEQELREALIRLRRVVIDFGDAPLQLAGAVNHKVRQVRSPLYALLVLLGKLPEDTVESVLKEAGAHYGINASWLGEPRRVRAQPKEAADLLKQLLTPAIEEIDRFELKRA